MKLNLLLTILIVLALVVVAALTLRAVIATQAVIYKGEGMGAENPNEGETQAIKDPCAGEPTEQGQNPTLGIDRCKQDLNLRATPRTSDYAYLILRPNLLKTHAGGCSGLTTPGLTG